MKRTLISAAVFAAYALSAGSAFALVPGNGTDAGTFDPATVPQVRISGSTALNGGIEEVIRRQCVAGSLDSFANATNQRVFVCTDGGTLGASGGAIAIHKESSGGSSNGIAPVKATTASLQFINLSSIATGCTTSVTVASVAPVAPDTLGIPAYKAWTCAGTTTAAVIPDIGFSDVDPALFSVDGSGLSFYSPNQLIFGVTVTKHLRDALQVLQGLSSGSDAVADTPSLSEAQIAAIYDGQIGTPAGLGLPNATSVGGGASNSTIFVVRRGTGSGTQATAEAYFLNGRVTSLASATPPFVAASTTFGAINYGGTGGTTVSDGNCGSDLVNPTFPVVLGSTKVPVFAGKANDDVINCLNRHDAGGRYAVGVNTSEYNQFAFPAGSNITTNFPTGFRYLKINGALPTIGNAIRGTYNYWAETVIAALPSLAGTPLTVLNTLNAQLGDPNVVSSINANYTTFTGAPAGETSTGLMSPGRSSACGAHVAFASMPVGNNTPDLDPVNWVTKNPSGSKVNNGIKPAIAVCLPRF